ncbi:hypothetical protein B0H17DRAFT_1244290 [Mycena rosella]|uniref:Uncharacterized protein n=1 Tax=Mycena rosella TaxID=1033263 RepID=A0AAD7DWK5_MYCRO|nr:hypothetical protein B0H17DRAFT_1244290 [Mycena rosella]
MRARFPDELWLTGWETLNLSNPPSRPAEKFRDLGCKAFLRNIVWTDPQRWPTCPSGSTPDKCRYHRLAPLGSLVGEECPLQPLVEVVNCWDRSASSIRAHSILLSPGARRRRHNYDAVLRIAYAYLAPHLRHQPFLRGATFVSVLAILSLHGVHATKGTCTPDSAALIIHTRTRLKWLKASTTHLQAHAPPDHPCHNIPAAPHIGIVWRNRQVFDFLAKSSAGLDAPS